MYELGKRSDCFGMELLQLQQIYGEPKNFPVLPANHKLICGYDQGLGERMIVCESLEEMQSLYSAYASGGALSINWYFGPDPGFVQVVQVSDPPAS